MTFSFFLPRMLIPLTQELHLEMIYYIVTNGDHRIKPNTNVLIYTER